MQVPTPQQVKFPTARRAALLALLGAAALLGGCAALNSLNSEVSSFGDWPADRKPGSYAFERLPSQQARAAETEVLENALRPALEKAGFTPVAPGAMPEVLVQVGARVGRAQPDPWADPIWWRGGVGYWRYRPWGGPGWGLSARTEPQRYERDVAVLLRDHASGKPLFEARASSEGLSRSDPAVLGAMFRAAMLDFPRLGVNPRSVVVQID